MYKSALTRLSHLLSLFIVLFSASFVISAQVIVPAATPTPTPEDKQVTTPDRILGVPEIAPSYRFEDRTLPDLGRVGVDMTEQRPMTLRDTLQMALENNKDIEVTRKNVRIAEFDLRGARGFYEPHFTGSSFYERSVTPSTSFFGGGPNGSTTQNSLVAAARFEGAWQGQGTTYRAEVNNSNVRTNNQFSTLNPLYVTTLSFNIAQPIFRGRRFDQPRRNIEVAKKNLSLTDTQFRQRTIETIASVQRAYWDLTFALRNLQVQRDAVRDAKNQMEHNRRLVREGQLAEIDVVASETQVATFELGVYDALDGVNRAENILKGLISPDKNNDIWKVALIPTDQVELNAPPTELSDALSAALVNRPEVQQNDIAKDINKLDQRLYRDLNKPQIDLVANYSLNGTAGSLTSTTNPFTASSADSTRALGELITRVNQIRPDLPEIRGLTPVVPGTLPGNLIGGYTDVFGNIFANRYPTLRVGINFNLPIFGNQTARAQLGHSLVEGERLQTQREQLEQQIQIDVRNAIQTMRTSEARLRTAAIVRENSERQYESEKRRLDEGQSTIFLVLERQTQLANARGAELRAQTELNKAIADLQRATGNSLTANNIDVKPGDRRESITQLSVKK